MTNANPQRRSTVVNKILTALKQHNAEKPDDVLWQFVRQYFANVPLEDLNTASPMDLCGGALRHWQLGVKRTIGRPSVRVYNPHVEKHGWQSTHTIIDVITRNKPFLVDSLSLVINRAGLTTHLTIHPVFNLVRDKKGTITAIADTHDACAESYMHFQVDRQTDPQVLAALQRDMLAVIDDIQRVTDDWQPMRAHALALAETLQAEAPHTKATKGKPKDDNDTQELQAFIHWLADNHFTFLGYCTFTRNGDTLKPVFDSTCGLLRDGDAERLASIVPYKNPHYIGANWLVDVTKTDANSTVHRPSPMDLISVQRHTGDGRREERICFVGLFTSAAYNLSVDDVPLLRQKVARVIGYSGLDAQSHDGKALSNILESYPRDTLFQSPAEDVLSIATGILHLQERQRIRLFGRSDQYQRFQSCMVYVPRDRYSRALRLTIQAILLDAFNGTQVEFDTLFSSESILARLYYVIHTDPNASPGAGQMPPDFAQVEQRIIEAARSWQDKLREALDKQFDEEHSNAFFNRYQDAFPSSYKDHFSPHTACLDIQHIEAARNHGTLEMNLYQPQASDAGTVNFKLFSLDTFIAPSDILPVLENMGLKVQGEHPYKVSPKSDTPLWIHEFTLSHVRGETIDPQAVGENFQDAFARIWRGDVENDGFNRLVIGANLGWRATAMLRAYCKYLLQIRVPFSQAYMIDTLAANTPITALLVKLFKGRFDPENTLSEAAQQTLGKQIRARLETVVNLDEDRILRGFLNVIEATLRSNYFQRDAQGSRKAYLAFKLDPAQIKNMPLPRPMFEIFVASPRVEGVHLRGGRVARGGLRWSDRREDFRTEVLGLMKAQMVKNAVIVPVGSKGGFVVKQTPQGGDRETLMNEVVHCYKTFLCGLLDLTDNLLAGKVVVPQQIVRYDGDDTYLVVAADKGTATFSDIANSVSADYGFWLGDAFASGGSIGYDHKKMGITARGAWESVKRHFRELGVNTQTQPFSVVGIGDMGGDVFGNGMLLSGQIQLLGAFNHLHIFLDPNPDPAASFAERKRLFELPRSSWEDYDAQLISKGGGLYKRSAKSIKLTRQVKAMLGISDTQLTPNELIHHLLTAPVDLLWNGGIGTYVKAATETHAEVRDRANDAVRINGADLRCKVVGEGGNLGLTQLGRIEYAQQGGILYTDAIDNAAGVDCSDHEVNIKILIDAAIDDGDITTRQRNRLLANMTDEVGELVLRDNYYQTQAISIENTRAPMLIEEHARFISTLESQGKLNRHIEYLPDSEAIAERMAKKQGLTRPELAVLVSYSKMTLYEDLLSSSLPEDSFLATQLTAYFPKPLRKKFAHQIGRHRLRREIVATVVCNEFVNRIGPTFTHRIHDQLGAHPADVCRAFVAGSALFDMPALWRDIEALDNQVSASTQIELLALVNGLSERCIHWLTRNRRTSQGIQSIIDYFKSDTVKLSNSMPGPLAEINRKTLQARVRHFTDAGVPEKLASRVSMLVPYSSALDIVDIAKMDDEKVEHVADVFFTLGSHLDLQWLRDQIAALTAGNHWHLLAKSGLRSDLHARQSSLTRDVLRTAKQGKPPQRVQHWQQSNADSIEKYTRLIAEMKASKSMDFAMLSLAVNEVHNLQVQ